MKYQALNDREKLKKGDLCEGSSNTYFSIRIHPNLALSISNGRIRIGICNGEAIVNSIANYYRKFES